MSPKLGPQPVALLRGDWMIKELTPPQDCFVDELIDEGSAL